MTLYHKATLVKQENALWTLIHCSLFPSLSCDVGSGGTWSGSVSDAESGSVDEIHRLREMKDF